MKRTKFSQFINSIDYFISYQSRLFIDLASVKDAVANGYDFFYIIDDLAFSGSQLRHYFKKSFFMGRERDFLNNCRASCHFMSDKSVDADTLAVAFCDDTFVIHLKQLIF